MEVSKPTLHAVLYAWHSNALRGALADDMPTTEEPQCGWFKRRLVRGGPFVPARIWMYQPVDPETGDLVGDEVLQCEIGGRFADPEVQFPWLARHPISEQEFNYLTALADWTAENAPKEPIANPGQPIDWLTVPTPTFERNQS